MKRKLLMGVLGTALAVSVAQNAGAQGIINVNNYDQSAGLFLGSFAVDAPTSTYVELLGGAAANTMTGVVTAGTGTAIFQLSTSGSGYVLDGGGATGSGSYFNAGIGTITGVAAGATGYFQLLAWTGAATFGSSDTYQFQSQIWTETAGTPAVGTTKPTLANMSVPIATPVVGLFSTSIPGNNNGFALTPVSSPEPSSLALAGLGGFGMLMAFRRKKA